MYGDAGDTFYINVHEGSELIHVEGHVGDGCQKHVAWCFINPGLPLTRRYFRLIGPGGTVYDRASLEYVGPLYEKYDDGDMLWLVFEDKQAKLDWVKGHKK
jgi:hypothetical protein